MRYLSILLFLAGAVALDAADASNMEDELRSLLDGKLKLAIAKVSCREYKPALENGVTDSACIELKDTTAAGNVSMIIRRHLSLTRWDAKVIEKGLSHRYFGGWYLPEDPDAAVTCWVYGKFEINAKVAVVQVPKNMSYDFVKESLTFAFDTFDIEKTHEITWDQESKTVTIMTLLEYRGNLDANGEVYQIKLDDKQRPTEIKKTGRWYS